MDFIDSLSYRNKSDISVRYLYEYLIDISLTNNGNTF